MGKPLIALRPPDDGQPWESQCARCGSSTDDGEECWQCGGTGGLGSDCLDDLCHGGECIHGDAGEIQCDICKGSGVLPPRCLSAADYCLANPLTGRESVERGAVEWFT